MSAEIVELPIVRVERNASPDDAPGGTPLIVRLEPRTAARLYSRARDCRITPGELAALLLDQVLFPQVPK